MSPWSRRFRHSGLALAFLLFVGATFEQVGAWRDRRRFPPSGTRVDIGGARFIIA